MSFKNTLTEGFNGVIAALGVDCVLTQAKPPNNTRTQRIGFKTAGADDVEIVNAYGISAKILKIPNVSGSFDPVKFDKVEITTGGFVEVYIIEAVQPIHNNGEVIGWKAVASGK